MTGRPPPIRLESPPAATPGSFPIPKGVPARYVATLRHLGVEVFNNGFAQAQHPTLILPIAVMAVGAVLALALRRDTGVAAERTLRPERTQEPTPAVVSDVLVTIASSPTLQARGIAGSVAERLGLPLLDLTGDGDVLAEALRRALSTDPGARHEAVNLVAGLLATPPPSPEQVRELALGLATRSGGVVLDTEYGRLRAGGLRGLRVTLEEGGRPLERSDARGRDLAPHLSLDLTAIPPETATSIILAAAAGTAGLASSAAPAAWTPAGASGYATASSVPFPPAE